MSLYNLISEKIKGRVLGVMGLGNSLTELEKRIEEFKDYDICWISLNSSDVIEDYILSKINKGLNIYFTLAPNAKVYDIEINIPLIKKVIDSGGIVLSDKRRIKLYKERFNNKYVDKIIDILNISIAKRDSESRAGVAGFLSQPKPINSMAVILLILLVFDPKKIILFGCDGSSSAEITPNDYFKPEIIVKRDKKYGLHGDIKQMNDGFLETIKRFKIFFEKDKLPEIVNCSPNSQYTIFRKINYNQLKEELNKGD